MPKNRLKNINIVNNNSRASSVNAIDGVNNIDVPNPTNFSTKDANPSNSAAPNLSQANSSEIGD